VLGLELGVRAVHTKLDASKYTLLIFYTVHLKAYTYRRYASCYIPPQWWL